MSKFKQIVVTEAHKTNVTKNQALDALTSIYTNIGYLHKLFYSAGGANNFGALNQFNTYKADIERKLNDISIFLNKSK